MTSSRAAAGARDSRIALAAGLTGIAVLLAAVVSLQIVRERMLSAAPPSQQILYVTSPALLKRLALSFDAILADIYWIRAIQYYGGTRLSERRDNNYDLLYPLLDIATSLDPHFSVAYRFGAFFLSEEKPGGAGRSDLAIRLLEKAMAAHPERWEYPHDVAFVHYRGGDYKKAAEWFLRAADVPGATPWLRPVAAAMVAAGGDTATARLLWRNLLDSEADWIRRDAERRLLQLDAIDQIAQLGRFTAEYDRRFGKPPTIWEDMIRAGMLRGIPVDPAGYPYVLDPWRGDVTLGEGSPLWPLPTERPK